ncbi:hypothetical protein B0H17DRAFT_1099781 [Mycena rosella]|uniref:Uncharacterized protein n=1 Tax=Mycena rosella TaxID=1033263 RepID=A0AAD7CND9_MYCRO|nr:hypothetical protein B0H17DRAFT_1099781 [Mycena rosella]
MASAGDSPDSDSGFLGSFSFSNNLVEVGALTALVGSSIAESLVLGNRGAAGISWAATSSFGTISVVKACFCGANSGWLRETLGIRTASSDLAVGLELSHESNRAAKVRRNIGEPLAIFCHVQPDNAASAKGHNSRKEKVAWSDVHAFNHSTSLMLRGVPDTAIGTPLQVFTYGNYNFLRPYSRFQFPAIILSSAKLVEVYILWRHGSSILGMASAAPWAFFFFGAVLIQAQELLLGRHPEPEMGSLDIIAGHLPMVSRPGGPRKVVLGAAENPKTSFSWRLFWASGALVSTASIISSYIIMSQQPRSVVFIWAGFQLLWLAVRILVYHLADPTNPTALRILVVRPWTTLPAQLKERVVDSTFALAKYQSMTHPRGQEYYAGDTFAGGDLTLISDGIKPPNLYPLPDLNPTSFPVEIKAVFGDTMLSSAIWITGSEATPMELYDTCIVVFSIRQSNHVASPRRSVAVPAARVLSGVIGTTFDAEKTTPHYTPKGASNAGYGLTYAWWYWIPCRTGLWLQIQIPAQRKTVGIHQVDVRTDTQVSGLLAAGSLNIGLKDVDEVKAAVALSRKAREACLELLS